MSDPSLPAPCPRRSLTLRALATGGVLGALLAILAPWNDCFLQNTPLFGHYLPPVLVLVLLVLALVVNPCLGTRRLHRGELAVVLVILLGVAGTASSGLMRYLPAMIARTPGFLAGSAGMRSLRVDLPTAQVEELAQAVAAVQRPALLVVLLFLGFMLVLSRLVAEAGLPFVQVPNDWFLNQTLFSLIGFSGGAVALMPLTLIGISLMADTRESLMPYAVNAGAVAESSGVPRHRPGLLLLAAAVLAALISGATYLRSAYTGHGLADNLSHSTYLLQNLTLEKVAGGIHQTQKAATEPRIEAQRDREDQRTWTAYGAGAGTVGALGLLRMRFSWWPLHPIGLLAAVAFPAWLAWFSFLLGWLSKWLVLRYGGTGLYRSLQPAAIGLIAGEAVAAAVFILCRLIHPNLPVFNVLS